MTIMSVEIETAKIVSACLFVVLILCVIIGTSYSHCKNKRVIHNFLFRLRYLANRFRRRLLF